MPADAQSILRRYDALKSDRGTWDTWWQEIADYVFPRKAEITERNPTPTDEKAARLYDTTAVRAVQIAATGTMAYCNPQDERWFAYKPPTEYRRNDRVQAWFSIATEVALELLANSNFYSAIHEFHLDRWAFGTAALYLGEDGDGVYFRAEPIASYCITEDYKRNPNSFFREFCYTPREAVERYGYDNLPEKIRAQYDDTRARDTAKCRFLHAVYRREERDPESVEAQDKPIASCHLSIDHKTLVSESGYDRMPYAISRFLEWAHGPYGYCPGFTALPAARQANFLSQLQAAAAEKLAFPPVLIPSTLQGEVDLRAGGQTVFDPYMPDAIPREWATAARYDVGIDFLDRLQREIERHYLVDLFQLFVDEDKRMTAREVAERSTEKLLQFSPTFARLTEEALNPILHHVFAYMVRTEKLPPPPEDVLIRGANGAASLQEPQVAYLSRIALAIASMQNVGAMRTLEFLTPIAQIDPTIFDSFNRHNLVREYARNEGVPESWLRTQEEMEQIAQQRAEQAQMEAQLEAAQMAADAANKAGIKVPKSA